MSSKTPWAPTSGWLFIRTEKQEHSREMHIAKDNLNLGHNGRFVTHLLNAFLRADRAHFDLLLPVVRAVIAEYHLGCVRGCPEPLDPEV